LVERVFVPVVKDVKSLEALVVVLGCVFVPVVKDTKSSEGLIVVLG